MRLELNRSITIKIPLLFFVLFFLSFISVYADDLRIGVLAKRGTDKTLERWKPMGDFLNKSMTDHTVSIIPLPFDKVETAIANKEIDFILTNSSNYVNLEMKYGVSRIVTMYNRGTGDMQLDKFGGVVFTRSDRKDINSFADTINKRFAAVDELSFGGWQMAWREFKKVGIDPYKEFSSLFFTQTHDSVVHAVLDGNADVGTVRTDTLEKMANEGLIDLKNIKVLNRKIYQDFPFLVSTVLYPEWPLAKLSGTSVAIAKELTNHLFDMEPTCSCSIKSSIGGWTSPADYKPVHDAMKELKLGEYKIYYEFSIKDVFLKYWYYFVITVLLFFVLIIRYFYILSIQRITHKTNKEIQELNKSLEVKVSNRTFELHEMNQTLEERVAYEVLENKKKDNAILMQSRYIAMDEVIQMLAHQWRQPLTIIEMGINNILLDLELESDDYVQLKEEANNISLEIHKLSDIIGSFSDKLLDDSNENYKLPQKIMDDVLELIHKTLDTHNITLNKEYTNNSEVSLVARQLFHIYLNLLNNAKEILIERDISDPKITITIEENDDEIITSVCDNGGGIKLDNHLQIFEPYFSTKKEKNEKGLGLYITKAIVEKQLKGSIDVKSDETNTCFSISIPKNTKKQ